MKSGAVRLKGRMKVGAVSLKGGFKVGRCVHEADETWGGESKGADEKWGGESVTRSGGYRYSFGNDVIMSNMIIYRCNPPTTT